MTSKTRLPITCSKYEPDHDGRRCRHYGGRGACALPDEFMCVEWLKANGHPIAPTAPVPAPITQNFFGDPMPVAPSGPVPSPGATSSPTTPATASVPEPPAGPSAPARPSVLPATSSSAPTAPALETPSKPLAALPRKASQAQVLLIVRDQDIASFKALGTEVRLVDEHVGEVWLVPAYTGQDRLELSVEHAALLAAICSAFPSASVTSFVRKPKRAVSPK